LNAGLVPFMLSVLSAPPSLKLRRACAGTPDQDTTTVRINADLRNRDRIK
jgi:hypothetical protein